MTYSNSKNGNNSDNASFMISKPLDDELQDEYESNVASLSPKPHLMFEHVVVMLSQLHVYAVEGECEEAVSDIAQRILTMRKAKVHAVLCLPTEQTLPPSPVSSPPPTLTLDVVLPLICFRLCDASAELLLSVIERNVCYKYAGQKPEEGVSTDSCLPFGHVDTNQ